MRVGRLVLLPLLAAAQTEELIPGFRHMATHGKRAEALHGLRAHLEASPRDVDARLLYGVILSWEGRHEEARKQLQEVLETSPEYADARTALIHVELWSDHPEQAENLARAGQELDSANVSFRIARIRALRKLNRSAEALEQANHLMALAPKNKEGRGLRNELLDEARQWEAGIDHFTAFFSDGRGSWHENRVSFRRYTRLGKAAARFSQARRYGLTDQMFEFEAYPRIRPGTYAFVSGGFSARSILFPHYRLAADVFQNLPHAMEASVGIRHFRFNERISLYTGSLGRYFGDWLLTARTYLSRDETGLASSVTVSGRRYFDGIDRYFGFRYGVGPSPFEVRSVNEIEVTRGSTFTGEINWKFQNQFSLNFVGGMSAEHRANRPGLKQYIVDLTLYYRF